MRVLDRAFLRIKRELNLQVNHRRVDYITRSIHKIADIEGEKPVIIFNASTRISGLSLNAGFSLVTGLALQQNGIPLHYFVCDKGLRPCVLGTDRENPSKDPPCKECVRTSRMIFGSKNVQTLSFKNDQSISRDIQGLRLSELFEYAYQGVPLGTLVLPSIRWILRRHHLIDDEKNRELARRYIQSAWNVYREVSRLIEKIKPRAMLVFNGMFFPEASARFAAQRKGVRVISHEVGMLPYSAFFTDKEATAYPVEVKDDFRLTEKQNQRLDDYLAKRFTGKFQTAGVRFWPEMWQLDDSLRNKTEHFSALVPVFTNVIFDTSQSHANKLFEHMFAWLDFLVEKIKQFPEILFVIRAHPDEIRVGKESRESVSEWVEKNKLSALQNVVFISPDKYVSSYELIRRAKFVMVYNSTVGLEASIIGKPVLCAGKARYTQVPTVFLPDSLRDYKKMCDKFLTSRVVDHPAHFIENARRVLYSQLFRASLPFDQFLEEDHIWRGYVRLKKFSPELLKKGHSEILDVVIEGILEGAEFIREI